MSPRTTSGKAWPQIVQSNPGYSSRCTTEYNIGTYSRSFSLSGRIDQNKIGAELELPKVQEAKPRTIQVK